MKKTYIQPDCTVEYIAGEEDLLLTISGTPADSTLGVETKDDNAWDIWGED